MTTDDTNSDVLRRIAPTVKPALIRLGLTIFIGVAVIGVLFTTPELLGSPEVTNVALIVVQLLVVIAVVRIGIELVVLLNTEYVVTDRTVRRQYSLLARVKSREVPYDLVRSTERSQGRIEYMLGVGSVSLNQGLGDLTLSYLPEHDEVYRLIRRQVENA